MFKMISLCVLTKFTLCIIKQVFSNFTVINNLQFLIVVRLIKKLVVLLILISPLFSNGQTNPYSDKFAHTYSIAANDAKTGEMAVGVQSHWFSVGTLVSWGKSGVGVVATQSFVNPSYGPQGLKLMESGISAKHALKQLTDKDEGRNYRQAAMVAINGTVGAIMGES